MAEFVSSERILPEGLAAAIHKALDKDPQRRFASAAAVRTAIEGFLEK